MGTTLGMREFCISTTKVLALLRKPKKSRFRLLLEDPFMYWRGSMRIDRGTGLCLGPGYATLSWVAKETTRPTPKSKKKKKAKGNYYYSPHPKKLYLWKNFGNYFRAYGLLISKCSRRAIFQRNWQGKWVNKWNPKKGHLV